MDAEAFWLAKADMTRVLIPWSRGENGPSRSNSTRMADTFQDMRAVNHD